LHPVSHHDDSYLTFALLFVDGGASIAMPGS